MFGDQRKVLIQHMRIVISVQLPLLWRHAPRLESNLEQNIQFEPPDIGWPIDMYELGRVVSGVIEDHCGRYSARAYTAMAANARLARYYKRLAKLHGPRLKFKYVQNLGKEGLHYAFIKED